MKPIVYLFGYDGWGPHVELMKAAFLGHNKRVRGRGLKWVDARLKRTVRAIGFRDNTPEKILGKDNYIWINEFGNLGIVDGGNIKIKDLHGGLNKLLAELHSAEKNKSDLILFCQCDQPDCHRYTVRSEILNTKEGKQLQFAEWSINEKTSLDLQKIPIKVTADAIHFPLTEKIRGMATPLTIAPGTSLTFVNKKDELETRVVGRVVPSADEKYAIIKTNYLLGSYVFPFCLFLSGSIDDFSKIAEGNQKTEINIDAKWTAASYCFDNARNNGQTLFVVISDADTNSIVKYYARIASVVISKKSNRYYTKIGIDNVKPLQQKVKTSSLKCDDGTAMSKNKRYDCAVVEPPLAVYELLAFR